MKKVVLFLSIVFFMNVIFYPAGAGTLVQASSDLSSTYDFIEENYPEYLQEFKDEGIEESQIKDFLETLQQEVEDRQDYMTKDNFDDVLLDSAIAIWLDTDEHDDLYEIALDEFEEVMESLQEGELPNEFTPLRDAIKDELSHLFEDPDEDEIEKLLDKIKEQIEEGREYLSLSAEENITLDGESLNAAFEAGKELQVEIKDVTFGLLPEAIDLEEVEELELSAAGLARDEAEALLKEKPENLEAVGSVYELKALVGDSTVKFEKPLQVMLSYKDLDISGIEEASLAALRYNEEEEKWVELESTLDTERALAAFEVGQLSKFALMGEPVEIVQEFKDTEGHWAESYVGKLYNLGYVSGVTEDSFAPDREITRAEFTAITARTAGIDSTPAGDAEFADVEEGKWYYDVVHAAAEAGLVRGHSKEEFAPEDPITREQIAVILTQVLQQEGIEIELGEDEVAVVLEKFVDQGEISSWAREKSAQAVELELVKGRPGDLFDPLTTATRAEAAVMILRMHEKI